VLRFGKGKKVGEKKGGGGGGGATTVRFPNRPDHLYLFFGKGRTGFVTGCCSQREGGVAVVPGTLSIASSMQKGTNGEAAGELDEKGIEKGKKEKKGERLADEPIQVLPPKGN